MFGNRRRIQELELQVESLTNELTAERQKQKKLQSELLQHQESAVNDKTGYEELRALYSQKLREQEDARAAQDEQLVLQAAEARKALNNELDASRKESQDHLQNSLKSFSDSYLHYLDQIKLLFEMLNAAAIRTGATLALPDEEHIEDLFSDEMTRALLTMSGIQSETGKTDEDLHSSDKESGSDKE